MCSNWTLSGNSFSQAGYTWNGASPHCAGYATVSLCQAYNWTVTNNVISNTCTLPFTTQDPQTMYGDEFDSLPFGNKTCVNFALAGHESFVSVYGNVIADNTFLATVDGGLSGGEGEGRGKGGGGTGGVGYFVGQGTGYRYSTWVPNTFSLNDPSGSDVGSVRCGNNVYEGNEDDFEHPQSNDGC